MPYKINIGEEGKSWKFEIENAILEGKSIGDVFDGKLIKTELEGYQLKITGGSDNAGFPLCKEVEGIALKRVLLKKGWGMHKSGKGLRLRKTVRGKTISPAVVQINCAVVKKGAKPLAEIFPEQNKPKENKENSSEKNA